MIDFVTTVCTKITSTAATSATAPIPLDSAGTVPKFVVFKSTATGYVRISEDGSAATNTDVMITPGDSLRMCTNRRSFVSFVADSGNASVQVEPLEFGGYQLADALAILAKYGSNAHVYLPGIGTLNGITAGNYLDSAGTTAATIDNPIGLVVDPFGAVNATQATTANKPILRLNSGKYSWQFDGVNDSLSLSAPLFQMSDDHAVIAGANCARVTGAVQVVFSPSRDASNGNSLGRIQFDATGTVSAAWTPTSGSVFITSTGSLVGSTKVLTACKTGNVKRLRVNAVQIGSDSTIQTDTGMTSASFSEYRTGLQLPFEGFIYPVIVIKGTVTDSDLLTLERFVGQLSGVSI